MSFGWVRAATVAAMVLAMAGCKAAASGGVVADDETARASTEFLETNAKAPGVVTTPSGLQYKVMSSGPAGGVHPDRNDLVSVFYEGALIDGTVFDSSFQRGVPYATHLDEVVPGWTEALQLMKPGDEWMLYVPAKLGYGDKQSGEIPPNSTLVFRVRLIDVAKAPGGSTGVGSANG